MVQHLAFVLLQEVLQLLLLLLLAFLHLLRLLSYLLLSAASALQQQLLLHRWMINRETSRRRCLPGGEAALSPH